MSPCPHCRALAQLERGGLLRWRCGVCGGPVVPTARDVARTNNELADLIAAQRARGMAIGWIASALLFGMVGATMLVLALPLSLGSRAVALLFGVVGGIAAVISATSARRAANRNAVARAKLDEAWEQVAAELIDAGGLEVTAPDLARAMHTDDEHAEVLLTHLSARGRVRVAVRDDAELAYAASDDQAQPKEPGDAQGRER
jgi:MFS family permease